MSWQPIETAPRDGSDVLALFSGGNVSFVRWVFNHRTKTTFWNDASEWDCYEYENTPPTHWMPLPEPPERKEESRA